MATLKAGKDFALRMNDLKGKFAPAGVTYSSEKTDSYTVHFKGGHALIKGQGFNPQDLDSGTTRSAEMFVGAKLAFKATGMRFTHDFGEILTFNKLSL
jgi:hypothetical protein